MQKLPIGRSVFKEIRTEDCCYVDKTSFVRQLFDDHSKYWFLSRPRRFGKTLFLDTLRAAFAGEKELFKGLFLEKNWDWSVKYPVVNISFGRGTVTSATMLDNAIYFTLNNCAAMYDIELMAESIPERFEELIQKINKKFNLGLVVLVDEYDKPLLDNLTKENAEEIREGLSSFYSVLKDADRYLKFVFLTGVSKFSKTSIFSKLNNLTDISLKPDYGDLCGYTQKEFEAVFANYLHDVDLEKVKDWYDGYNFLGSNVYNPYDILLFLSDKRYQCYWFETGTPSFLLDLIKKRKYFLPGLDNIELRDSQMAEFDINHIELDVLLYQSGYLTIRDSREIASRPFYSLRVPNKEVSIGLNDYLLRMFFASGTSATATSKLSIEIFEALSENHPDLLEKAFISFFAGIPYQWYVKNNIAEYEGYYCSVFYSFFAALGLTVIPEDITNKGRIDFTVIMDKGIFIFEIKMKSNSENAMDKLRKRKYHEKYLTDNKEIFLVGIEFDEKDKNLSDFETVIQSGNCGGYI
jgi:hypothetical protein